MFRLLILFFSCLPVLRCATSTPRMNLAELEPVREGRYPAVGAWQPVEDGITNVIPGDTDAADIVRAEKGAGVSLGCVKDFSATDLSIEAKVSFLLTGSPCLVFRVQEGDGVVREMYSLALFAQGVNLWRLRENEWVLLYTYVLPLDPGKKYRLGARTRGETIEAFLDGKRLFESHDATLVKAGRAGVCGREGPCLFANLRVASHDK
ncbi:MAG: hypothetical protein HY706_08820 [Candidatus Hydrogenedentes bacterium]|nr:hypothetical protein [Candidatus Hydrogenedentota bacterium]